MSQEATIFDDSGMTFKNQFDSPRVVAEAYNAISNLYGDVCSHKQDDRQLFDFLQTANSALGELQGNMDNIAVSELDGHAHIPVTTHNGHAIPVGTQDIAEASATKPQEAKKGIQRMLRENLAEPQDSSEPEPEPEPQPVESQEVDARDFLLDNVKGCGETTLDNLAQAMEDHGVDSLTVTPENLQESDNWESLADVPADELAQMDEQQIAALQQSLA